MFRSTSTGAGAGTENVAETGRYCPFFLCSGSVFGLWIRICIFFYLLDPDPRSRAGAGPGNVADSGR